MSSENISIKKLVKPNANIYQETNTFIIYVKYQITVRNLQQGKEKTIYKEELCYTCIEQNERLHHYPCYTCIEQNERLHHYPSTIAP